MEEPYPYLVLDARYERVREAGGIRSRAVLIAVGINEEGRRCVLGVDLANRESTSSWRAHSSLIDRTNRSAQALRFGLFGGSRVG